MERQEVVSSNVTNRLHQHKNQYGCWANAKDYLNPIVFNTSALIKYLYSKIMITFLVCEICNAYCQTEYVKNFVDIMTLSYILPIYPLFRFGISLPMH